MYKTHNSFKEMILPSISVAHVDYGVHISRGWKTSMAVHFSSHFTIPWKPREGLFTRLFMRGCLYSFRGAL